MQKLNINEIFVSVNGEVNKWGQGSPAIFIRLQGCNLSCCYCDTKQAQSKADYDPIITKHLLTEIESYGIKRVTITGGEPLLQESVFDLIEQLLFNQYQISIETNGSIKIPEEWIGWRNLCWVVDYKPEYSSKMIWENYLNLMDTDWIKFIIKDRIDFARAISIKNKLQDQNCRASFAFSPVGAGPELAGQIVQWLIDNEISDVNLNLQIHKIISVK